MNCNTPQVERRLADANDARNDWPSGEAGAYAKLAASHCFSHSGQTPDLC